MHNKERNEYSAVHVIGKATVLDQGTFTCQIEDFGLQQCASTQVDVRASPKVWLEPMSLTVRKVNIQN